MKKNEMINKIYNNLLVLEEEPERRSTRIYYKCKCLKCNTIFSAEGQHIRKEEVMCPNCRIKVKSHKDIANQRFGKLVALYPTDKREFGSVVWMCRCDCGNTKEVSLNNLNSFLVQSCGCLRESVREQNIKKILDENNINYISQFSFEKDKRKKYDFAILNKDNQIIRLIEFDGKQHFGIDADTWFKSDSYKIRRERDNIKNQIAKEYNIPLVRIPYWERDHITLDMIIGDKYEVSIN